MMKVTTPLLFTFELVLHTENKMKIIEKNDKSRMSGWLSPFPVPNFREAYDCI